MAIVVALVALFGAADPAQAAPSDPRLHYVGSWAFAIGNHTLDGNAASVGARYAPFELVMVDGEEVRADEIAAMRANGSLVLG
jgi:hypothetical protein